MPFLIPPTKLSSTHSGRSNTSFTSLQNFSHLVSRLAYWSSPSLIPEANLPILLLGVLHSSELLCMHALSPNYIICSRGASRAKEHGLCHSFWYSLIPCHCFALLMTDPHTFLLDDCNISHKQVEDWYSREITISRKRETQRCMGNEKTGGSGISNLREMTFGTGLWLILGCIFP